MLRLRSLKDSRSSPTRQRSWLIGSSSGPRQARNSAGMALRGCPSSKGIEWVLVEAMANHPEFCTPPCGAAKHGGRPQIQIALNPPKNHLGVDRDFSWLGSYYQPANRLASLYFLSTQSIRAHLVEILFV